MSPQSDPPRWLDDPSADPALREVLGSVRELAPSAPTHAAIQAGVRATVSASAGAAQSGVWLLFGGTVVALLVAAVLVRRASAPPAVVPSAPRPALVANAPAPSPALAPSLPAPSLPALSAPLEAPARAEPAARPRPIAQRAARVVASPSAPAATVPCDEDSRMARFTGADARLRGGDPGAALAALDEDSAHCGAGSLGEERDELAIRALLALGHTEQARARASAFEQRFPRSTHLRRVRELVGPAPLTQ